MAGVEGQCTTGRANHHEKCAHGRRSISDGTYEGVHQKTRIGTFTVHFHVHLNQYKQLFLLEEVRERKFDAFARTIQKAFRRYNAAKHYARIKQEAADLYQSRKERRANSIHRNYVGDYIGLEHNAPGVQALIGRRERVYFAHTVTKYDRRFKVRLPPD
jgi:hypothetical protein